MSQQTAAMKEAETVAVAAATEETKTEETKRQDRWLQNPKTWNGAWA